MGLTKKQKHKKQTISTCSVCGGSDFTYKEILFHDLIEKWELSSYEVDYINRQQGERCSCCMNNLRSMALAKAIVDSYQFNGTLEEFVESKYAMNLKILEINAADTLSPILKKLPGHLLVTYPECDMMKMKFNDKSWDLIVHSDTLEHIKDPIKALSECRRILSDKGKCIFTVPIIVDRTTRSREDLSKCYHGKPDNPTDDYLVYTEFGSDFWKCPIKAGFEQCAVHVLDYPSAIAIEAAKTTPLINKKRTERKPEMMVKNKDQTVFTGERYVPEVDGDLRSSHLLRYAFACEYVKGKRVLDIACGEGYGSAMLAADALEVVGVDISQDTVEHAKAKYKGDNLTFKVGSCSSIPLSNSSLDVVASFETIEHHDQHDAMLDEIKRVLKPEGMLIISSPDKRVYSDVPQSSNPFHVKELYHNEFEELLKKYFENVTILGQKMVYGSAIFPIQDVISFSNYDIEMNGQDTARHARITGLKDPIYLVAIASDSDFSEVVGSFLEQSIEDSKKFRQMIDRTKENDFNIFKNELYNVYNSRSWKCTAPLRALGALARKILRR